MNMNSMPGLDRHLNSGNPMDDSSGDSIDVIAGELNTMPIAELVETFIQFRSEAELRELLNDDDLASEVFDSRVESANDDAEQHKADSRDDDRYGY